MDDWHYFENEGTGRMDILTTRNRLMRAIDGEIKESVQKVYDLSTTPGGASFVMETMVEEVSKLAGLLRELAQVELDFRAANAKQST